MLNFLAIQNQIYFCWNLKTGTTVSTQMDLVDIKVKPNFKTNIIGGKRFHEKGN